MAENTEIIAPGTDDGAEAPTVEPTAEDIAEDAEWDAALKEFAGDKIEEGDDTNGTADTTTTTTTEAPTTTETTTVATTTTTTINPDETPEEKLARETKAAEDAAAGDGEDEDKGPDTSSRDARRSARDSQQQIEATAKDVREKMYADTPQHLQDADGDPITSPADVMKLINPQTSEPFTEVEAQVWLLSAQKTFNENLAKIDKEIEGIAELNVDLKDEADSISYKYGELLKGDTKLRDKVWAKYEKTLIKDPKSGIIIKAPISMEEYYDDVLEPYVDLARSLEAQEEAKAAQVKAEEAAKKTRTRADRSDIFGRGQVDDGDEEDKEWAAAAKSYYGK